MSMQVREAFWERPVRGYTIEGSDFEIEMHLSITVRVQINGDEFLTRTYVGHMFYERQGEYLRAVFEMGIVDEPLQRLTLRSFTPLWVNRRFRAEVDRLVRRWIKRLKNQYGAEYVTA